MLLGLSVCVEWRASGGDGRPAVRPGLCLLELAGEPEERGFVAEAAEEVDADRQPCALVDSGTDMAGLPVTLAIADGVAMKAASRAATAAGSAPGSLMGSGGWASDGVSQTSWSVRKRAISRLTRWSSPMPRR